MKPLALPFPQVLVILLRGMAGPRRYGLTAVGEQLFGELIQAHERALLSRWPDLYPQHVLHGSYEGGILFGRDTPEVLPPEFELAFFDMPAKEHVLRKALLRTLRGCGCLQKSVWISPILPEELRPLIDATDGLPGSLLLLEADSRGAG